MFYDDFSYPVRDSLEGIGGWGRTGNNSAFNIKIISPGLTYSGYSGSGIGNTTFFSNNTDGDICYHNITQQTSGSVYMSFMIKIDSFTTTATQGYCISFNQGTGATLLNTKPYIKKVTSNTFNFGISKSTNAPVFSGTVYSVNSTYLVVVKYTFASGSSTNDTAKIYVFSSGVPAAEPASPDAVQADGDDVTDIGNVILTNSYAQTGLKNSPVKVDGIRVGKSWATSILNSVSMISSEIPSSFSLSQNYPNPFNPSTKINYQIKSREFVSLKIYDIQGNEVSTLVNKIMNAGTYEAQWNAADLPSGVYYYKLFSGNFSGTKKMILVK